METPDSRDRIHFSRKKGEHRATHINRVSDHIFVDIRKELRSDFEMSDKDEEHAQRERENSQCNRTHNLERQFNNY
jgi:hypothetical protein